MKLFSDLPGSEAMQERLYMHKVCIGLNEIAAKIDQLHKVTLHDLELNRNLTLNYLLPILKDGMLKVKICDYIFRMTTPEDRLKFKYELGEGPMNFPGDATIYTDPTQAEAAIADIERRWVDVSRDLPQKAYAELTNEEKQQIENRHTFEYLGVRFALPNGRFDM